MEFLPKTRKATMINVDTYKYQKKLLTPSQTPSASNPIFNELKTRLKYYRKPVIVKIQNDDENTRIKRELSILHLLGAHDFQNIPKLICEFSCIDDKENQWIKQVNKYMKITVGQPEPLHFTVIEYIENGEICPFMSSANIDTIRSFFLQTACMIIQLSELGIKHNLLYHCNFLVKRVKHKTATYKIQNTTYNIPTYGHIPILTDFGMINRWTRKMKMPLTYVIPDISHLFRICHFGMEKNDNVPKHVISNIENFVYNSNYQDDNENKHIIENTGRLFDAPPTPTPPPTRIPSI